MADIETNSGRSLQYNIQPVATAQWSEAVKVRLGLSCTLPWMHRVACWPSARRLMQWRWRWRWLVPVSHRYHEYNYAAFKTYNSSLNSV